MQKVMRIRFVVVCCFFALMFYPTNLLSHGTHGTVGKGGLAITAQYDTGEAMSYAKVSIAAPGAKLPFQSGRTDKNGRFCFFQTPLANGR